MSFRYPRSRKPKATTSFPRYPYAFLLFPRLPQDGLTAMFWPEGKVIWVLESDLDPGEVIRLAFAKAVRVPV